MKNFRHIIMLVMLVMLLGLTAGCAKKPTAVSLAADAAAGMKNKKSVECDTAMDFSLEIGISEAGIDMSIDMDMSMDMESKFMMDSPDSYNNIELSVEMMDESEEISLEMYTTEEQGELVAYMGMDGTWSRMALEDDSINSDSVQSFVEFFEMIQDGKIEAELLEDTQEIKGNETYVIEASVSGDMLSEMGGAAFAETFEAMDFDMAGLKDSKIEGTFYIDKKEKVLRRVSFELESFLDALFESIDDFEGAQITVSECSLVMDITDYDSFDEITIPDDVKEAAKDIDEEDLDLIGEDEGFVPYEGSDDDIFGGLNDDYESDWNTGEAVQDADGNYIISDYDGIFSATVAAPDGFEAGYIDSNYASFRDNGTTDIDFWFDGYTTEEEMLKSYSDTSYEESIEDYSDIVTTEAQTKNINGMEVTFVAVAYMYADSYPCKDYYAWTKVGDDTFLVACASTFDGEDTVGMTDAVVDLLFNSVKIGSDI